MAATKTLAQLRTITRELADLEDQEAFADTPELDRRVNEGLKALYDLLIRTRGQEFYRQEFDFVTVDQQRKYKLPPDFYLLLQVIISDDFRFTDPMTYEMSEIAAMDQFEQGSGGTSLYHFRYRLVAQDIEIRPKPQANFKVRLYYVPAFEELVEPKEKFDGVNGWELWACLHAAIAFKQKGEESADLLMAEKADITQRIRELAAGRDASRPPRIQDRNRDWAGADETYLEDQWSY